MNYCYLITSNMHNQNDNILYLKSLEKQCQAHWLHLKLHFILDLSKTNKHKQT